MHRKTFIKNSGLFALGLAAYGNVSWRDGFYVGDSPTTSDILGPFYRPGAPLRTNLNPVDYTGEILHLSGTVYQEDGKTPAKNCKMEIWQCKADGFYDNTSDEYNYRGYTTTANNGKYHFVTAQPPPEPTDETKAVFRPAHIHLRISAAKQQDLITQIYFTGDQLLPSDPSTSSSLAINRTLSVEKLNEKDSQIRFDIVLGKERAPEKKLLQQVAGIYKMSDGSLMEFYTDKGLLFYKINGQIWGALNYHGNASFTGMSTEVTFLVQEDEGVTLHFEFLRRRQIRLDGKKILRYQAGE